MNKNILLGIVVILLIAGGVILLNRKNTNTTQNVQNNTVVSSPTPMQENNNANVTVTNQGFVPQTLTIKVGTKVVWTNKSGGAVTINSDVHPTHLLYPFLNLGEFNDATSVSVVVDKPGTYTYHNHLNPSETGTIIVE